MSEYSLIRYICYLITLLLVGVLSACVQSGVQEPDIQGISLDYEINTHNDRIEDLEFSPDGDWFAAASLDNTAKIWNAKTGILQTSIDGHKNFVRKVDFSSDSKFLLTCSDDESALVSDLSGEMRFRLQLKEDCVDAHFAENDTKIYTLDGRGRLSAWDAISVIKLENYKSETSGNFNGGEFSPDGSYLAYMLGPRRQVGKPDEFAFLQNAEIYNVESGNQLRTVPHKYITHLNWGWFSEDNKFFALVYGNQAPSDHLIINRSSGKRIASFRLKDVYTYSAMFSPKNRYLLTANYDERARVIEVSSQEVLFVLEPHKGLVFDAVFSSTGERVATSTGEGKVFIWNVEWQKTK